MQLFSNAERCGLSRSVYFPLFIFATAMIGLLIAGGCQQSADVPTGEASKVAEQANSALANMDWDTYSGLMHPDAADEFQNMVFPTIEAMLPKPSDSVLQDTVVLFGQDISVKALRDKPAPEFFAAIMNLVFDNVPQLRQTFLTMQTQVVGEVAEGSDLVHVVSRTTMTINQGDLEEMNVLTMRRDDDAWRMSLSSKIKGLAQLIQQFLGAQRG